MTPLRFYSLLGVVTFSAFAIRLAAVGLFQGFDTPPDENAQPDQLVYEELANELATYGRFTRQDGTPTATRPPGTPAILAAAYLPAGRSFCFGRIWFCLLSAATCIPLAFASRRIFNDFTALLASAWLALTPSHFYYPMHFVSEVPYGLATATVTALLLAAVQSPTRSTGLFSAAMGGVAVGIAVLIRPQAIFIVPGLWLSVFFYKRTRQWSPASLYTKLILCSLVSAVIVGGWVLRNRLVVGSATISTVGAATFVGAHNPFTFYAPAHLGSWVTPIEEHLGASLPREEFAQAKARWSHGLAFVKAHWKRVPYIEWCKIRNILGVFLETDNRTTCLSFAAAWLFTGPFVLLGLVLLLRSRPFEGIVAMSPLLALLATTLIFYGSIRFRQSAEPTLVMVAAHGASVMATAVRRKLFGLL